MTTKEYYEQWHRELSDLINAARSGTITSTEVEVEQPKAETHTPDEVIITFRVFTSRQKKWNERIFIVYSPNRIGVIDNTLYIKLAVSPLPPGVHINCYCAPSILAIQHEETVRTTIKWEHFQYNPEIRDFWNNLPNPFELAVVVGYNTEHPTLDPSDDRPTKYWSYWRELNQMLEWQKLVAFVFKVKKPKLSDEELQLLSDEEIRILDS